MRTEHAPIGTAGALARNSLISRLRRRTVRKGFAFPASVKCFCCEAPPHEPEAQPPNNF